MSKLPMNARLGFRDLWENPNAPAQKALKTLHELLGYQVDVEIDSPQLWSDLQRYYPDPGTFAPNITNIIRTWAECLTARLQDDSNAGWTENLLDHITEGGTIVRARLEPHAGTHVNIAWSKELASFTIAVPDASPPYSDDPGSTIAVDLQNLFTQETNMSKTTTRVEDNGRATVTLPSRDKIPANVPSTTLPSVHSLARPEILFSSQAPYHMTLQTIQNSISVRGSHQPSLQLLKDYFEKYARADHNNAYKTPLLKIELEQSFFGYGNFFDSLTISPTNRSASWISTNPILMLSFIENTLGYQTVPEMSSGGLWQFRRDVPFK